MKQDHHDDEDEPTITLNIHETLPDEKENNHDNGGEDINKPILTEFLKTTKVNKKQYENGDSKYDSPAYKVVEKDSEYWIIYNKSTGKILKSINYNPVDFSNMLNQIN